MTPSTLGCTGIGLYLAGRAAYEFYPRFSFRFSVCFNISHNFCIVCTQPAFFVDTQRVLGDFQIIFQIIFASFVPDFTNPRGFSVRRDVIICDIYELLTPEAIYKYLLCCWLHPRLLDTWYVGTAYITALQQLLYAAAVHYYCCQHTPHTPRATCQSAENALRPTTESFQCPCLLCTHSKIRTHSSKVSLGPAWGASPLHALLFNDTLYAPRY